MKIGTKDMYICFSKEANQRKALLEEEKENYLSSKTYLLNKLKDYEHYIINFTNIRYHNIHRFENFIKTSSFRQLASIAQTDTEQIRRTINIIVQINRSLKLIEEELQFINDNNIDEEVHKKVIYAFNQLISDEIIYKGYRFKLGSLGFIGIKKVLCDKRIKKRINWAESFKKKQEIISKGEIPFKVLERDENKKPIKDNKGVNWFVYFTGDFDYLFHWNKNRSFVFNSAYYRFKPTRYNNTNIDGSIGNINKLGQLKLSNSPLLANFV